MSINWFPGHMATARKEIRRTMPVVDLVIEVLDARIPASSENPLVAALRGEKPCIQVLNKADLADPTVTAEWLAVISARPGLRAVAHVHLQPHLARTLTALARSLVPESRVRNRPLVAMIVGIPNVGKSTLINTLAGRHIAKVGNKPAITQLQQRVKVTSDLELLDTPGFLWPKLSPPSCGYRLAVTGAIADRVIDPVDIATFAARFLAKRYPDRISTFYGIAPELDGLIEAIGRRRGFLGKGGIVDMQKSAERLLQDLRAGAFGGISLERPAEED